MSRRSFLLGAAIVAAVVLIVGGLLMLLVSREPDHYQSSALPPGPERLRHSQDFQARCSHLVNDIAYEKSWVERFTEAQINSYFDEDFVRSGISKRMLPEGISQPRVAITPDRIRLSFRYGVADWCGTVVTIDLRVKLAQAEPNCVALELQGLHAGTLPISTQSLLERVSEVARGQDIEVEWYRNPASGNAVALLRFQPNQTRPTVRLDRLELNQGELVIGGRSDSAAPLRAMMMGDPEAPPAGN